MSARTVTSFAEFIALKKLDPRKPILANELDQIVNDQIFVNSCGLVMATTADHVGSVSGTSVVRTYESIYGRATGYATYYARCAVRIFASGAGSAFDVTVASVGAAGSVVVFSGDPTTTPTWRVSGDFAANTTDDFTITMARTAGAATGYFCAALLYAV